MTTMAFGATDPSHREEQRLESPHAKSSFFGGASDTSGIHRVLAKGEQAGCFDCGASLLRTFQRLGEPRRKPLVPRGKAFSHAARLDSPLVDHG